MSLDTLLCVFSDCESSHRVSTSNMLTVRRL